jgi:MFS family permease
MTRGFGLVLIICAAEVLAMAGAFAFPALIPRFIEVWNLTNTEAGWIAGIYFAGYTVAVPVLVSLTDRIDARLIFFLGVGLSAVAAAGFAFLAEGFWTAFVFRALAGAGLSGIYMPGLRTLVDRLDDFPKPRAVALYTACFALGGSVSFFAAGTLEQALGWRAVFVATSVLALLSGAVVALATRPGKPQRPVTKTALLDFRPVFRNRAAMAYILGYGVHGWELLGARSWMVAFLTFSLTLDGGTPVLAPATVAALAGMVAMVSSVGGQEVAARFGRRRVIAVMMLCSAAFSCAFGFTAPMPYFLVVALTLVYAALLQSDSAALTAGAVETAEPGRSGATLAVHSVAGFIGGFIGPLAMGMVLDLGGGDGSAPSWGLAFISLGVVGALGPIALIWLGRRN